MIENEVKWGNFQQIFKNGQKTEALIINGLQIRVLHFAQCLYKLSK